jgi:predicted nucleic acid-binding protein
VFESAQLPERVIKQTINITNEGHPNSGFPSFYDSAYHALAIELDSVFVTADKRHKAKTETFGHIVLLHEWESGLGLC